MTLRVAEENLGLPRKVSRFVLTVGATANQNGTALFEGVTVLFLAQFFGVDLPSWPAGDGAAALHPRRHRHRRRAVGLAAGDRDDLRRSSALAPEGIGMILGVNPFLDMCRTALNVTGDLAHRGASCRAAGEPRSGG